MGWAIGYRVLQPLLIRPLCQEMLEKLMQGNFNPMDALKSAVGQEQERLGRRGETRTWMPDWMHPPNESCDHELTGA